MNIMFIHVVLINDLHLVDVNFFINMKRYNFIFLVSMFLCTPCFSQMNNLERKEESQRKEYLTNIAKEVILTFGPDYYRDFKEPIISDTITFRETFKEDSVLRNKNFYGRKYYSVKYLYDPSIEKFLYNFVAEVDIWADDGQPKEVRFGNGYGQNFYITSYKKWKKRGIKESEIIPYSGLEINSIGLSDTPKNE